MKITNLKKFEFSPSPFRVTSQTAQPIQLQAGSAGTVLLVSLKGLGENSISLQICNLYTIQFHISLCSSWLQFAWVLIRFWELPGEKFQNSKYLLAFNSFCFKYFSNFACFLYITLLQHKCRSLTMSLNFARIKFVHNKFQSSYSLLTRNC